MMKYVGRSTHQQHQYQLINHRKEKYLKKDDFYIFKRNLKMKG